MDQPSYHCIFPSGSGALEPCSSRTTSPGPWGSGASLPWLPCSPPCWIPPCHIRISITSPFATGGCVVHTGYVISQKTSQGLSSELPYSSYSNIAAAAAMGVSAHPTSVPMSHSAPSIGTHSAPSSDTLVTPSATATVSTNPPGYKMEPTVKHDSDVKM